MVGDEPVAPGNAVLTQKLKDHGGDFLAAERLKEIAINNWQVLYGEDLPS